MIDALPHRLVGAAIAVALLGGVTSCRRGPEGAVTAIVIGDKQPALGDPLRPPVNEGDALLRLSVAQGLVRFDAGGQIEPGLAERWNVSDDGLSYIFRLQTGEWPDGRKIIARDVARMLSRQIKAGGDNPTRDALGAVDEVVAMTDRVIEIRLRAPRPNLLTLLAQPEFALFREGVGTGPFRLREKAKGDGGKHARPEGDAPILLARRLPGVDGEESEREEVAIRAMPAAQAIAAFLDDRAALVLGGTVADLPLATRGKLPRNSLRFDPVAGLIGLAPARADGPAGDEAVRRLLSEAIDRGALVAALAVPGLSPRATLLQGGLAGLGDPPQPAWLAQPPAERRAVLLAEAKRLAPRGPAEPRTIAVDLPKGPGGDLILARLAADWAPLGFEAVRAGAGHRADFRWLDAVAPSDSPAWFLRQFRCAVAPVCAAEADELLASARAAPIAQQRAALFAEAARKQDEAVLFIALTAPVRWSLVSRQAPGFIENRYARHPLGLIAAKPAQGGAQ